MVDYVHAQSYHTSGTNYEKKDYYCGAYRTQHYTTVGQAEDGIGEPNQDQRFGSPASENNGTQEVCLKFALVP